MHSILLSVEGPSDQGVFDGLNQRLPQNIVAHPTNGNRPNKISGYFKHRQGFSKYIMCKDLHSYREQDINRLYNEAKAELDDQDKPLFEKLIIKFAIEAWFLSDIEALNTVSHCDINTPIINPENIENPDEYLTELLRTQGKDYIKNRNISKEIMKNIDLTKLHNNCSSYQDFINIIT